MKPILISLLFILLLAGCGMTYTKPEWTVACLYEKATSEEQIDYIEKVIGHKMARPDKDGNLIVKDGEFIPVSIIIGNCFNATCTPMGYDYEKAGKKPIRCEEVLYNEMWRELLPKAEDNKIWILNN